MPSGLRPVRQSEALDNFRLNFALALEFKQLSLRLFARQMGMSASHLSRIRSATAHPGYIKPVVPGLDAADLISQGLGLSIADMCQPPSDFLLQLQRITPGWKPTVPPEISNKPNGARQK